MQKGIAQWINRANTITAVLAVIAFLGGLGIGNNKETVPKATFRNSSLVAEIGFDEVITPQSATTSPREKNTSQKQISIENTSAITQYLPSAPPPAPKPAKKLQNDLEESAPLHTSTSSSPPTITVERAATSRICEFETTTPPSGGSLVLNEIAWMGGLESANDEWIELRNRGEAPLPLSGFQLIDEDEQVKIIFTDHDSIPAHGYYLLERTDDHSVEDIVADKLYSGVLGNTKEGVRLFNAQCVLIDEVIANPSWPAGDAGRRKTMERDGNSLEWHTSAEVGGTPKAENTLALPPPPEEATLSIILGGDGTGLVRSNPQGIECGDDCDEAYPVGTQITLMNLPSAGSEFNRWEGACTGSQSCSLTLEDDATVSAIFRIPTSGAPTPPSPSPNPPSPSPSPQGSGGVPAGNSGRLVISEVQITGGAGVTTNDFIEFYNPDNTSFNLKGYRLVKRTAQGSSDTTLKSWTDDTFVPAHGFYLWANANYTAISATPDVTTAGTIADNNAIALRLGAEDTGTIIDAVGWGELQNNLFEGTALPGGLEANQSYERKALQGGTCVSAQGQGEQLGNACDTNQNTNDFEMRPTASPQNTQSLPEG